MSYDLILPFFPEEIRTLLLDPSISDLMINGTSGVYADRVGVVEHVKLADAYTNARLTAAIERVARVLGQDLTSQNPILNTRLPDGSRVAVVGSPASIGGPTLTIRKFNKWYTSDELVTSGSLPREVCDLVVSLIGQRKNGIIAGGTGSGKSTLLRQMLSQIEDRKETAIVYDPAGEFIQRFYREDRGDVILNPLDARSSYWSPAAELKNAAEAQTIAVSLYQPPDEKPSEFFIKTPQKIFAHLLKYRPSVQDLIAWMSNPDEIDRRVEGTELAQFIGKDSPDQRNGVLGSLGLIADSFRLLPTKKQTQNREWSATAWAEKREGWIFLTGTEAEQEALRPLHSLWIDLLILRLLTEPEPGQKRAWFVLDELATLQKLPQFHSALTKGRKSDNPIIFGYPTFSKPVFSFRLQLISRRRWRWQCGRRQHHRRLPRSGVKGGTVLPFHALHGSAISTA